MLEPGSRVDRYVVEGAIGRGGMAAVYRAFDTRLRRRVALKVVHGDRSTMTHDTKARMMREARTVAALSHPNVVTIFDVGEADGFPFLAMEMLKGSTLRSAMHDESATLSRKLRWLLEVADALAAAHHMGIIHRDIKPENVMVLDTDSVKVLDFGIARVEDAERHRAATGDAAPSSFRTAGVAGTPKYMAPEHRRGDRIDARADQFAWGLVAYEVLAMRHPSDELPEFSAAMEWSISARPLVEIAPHVPRGIADVVMRALEREREQRWPSMDDVVDALIIAEPSLEPARPRRSTSEPEVEPAPAVPPRDQVTTVPVSVTTEATEQLELRRERVDEPAAPSVTTSAVKPRAVLALAGVLTACVAGYLLVRGGLAPRVSSATARCALDEATLIDLDSPIKSFGVVSSRGGVLVAGSAPVGGTEVGYAAVAQIPPGHVERKTPHYERIGRSLAHPTRGREVLVAMYMNNPLGGTFSVTEPEPSDGGFSRTRDRSMVLSPLNAHTLIARAVGDTVFAAVSAVGYTKTELGSTFAYARSAPVAKVAIFAHTPGSISKGILDEDGALIALAAKNQRAAALVAHGPEIRVAFFDVTAQPLGAPIAVATNMIDEGAVTFVGDDVVAIWRAPATAKAADHWETSIVGTTASPPRSVPGTEGALAPDLLTVDGGLEAVWVQRGAKGSELRFSTAKDPLDLPRASVVLRATEGPLNEPKLAIDGKDRWLVWLEGSADRARAAKIRCD